MPLLELAVRSRDCTLRDDALAVRGGGEHCLEMVFLKGERALVSRSAKSVARSQSELGTRGATRARKTTHRGQSTHVCVLSVDAGGRDDPCALLVLVENDWIRIDVALDDLEACLVCDPIAVSERRVACSLRSRGHNMGVGCP